MGLSRMLAGCVWLLPVLVGCNRPGSDAPRWWPQTASDSRIGLFHRGPAVRTVHAEFAGLENKRVLVLVWVDPNTLDEHPQIRLDLARHVAARLREHVRGVTIVEPGEVERSLPDQPGGLWDPAAIGRQFGADVVVYLEVAEFSLRDPREPQYYQARITASVFVYDLARAEQVSGPIELSRADLVAPAGGPVSVYDASPRRIRKLACEQFAEVVARKFYDHQVQH